jgi:hypothetical protein
VRKGIFTAVLAMLAVSAMMLAGASSAAKPGAAVSSAPRAVDSHIGANVIRQVGLRNYAGPNCPGRGWNCTSSTRVLQIASDDGENVAQCTDGTVTITGPKQSCSITQMGSINSARCFERSNAPGASQDCTITQIGAKNKAVVDQLIVQNGDATQTGVPSTCIATCATQTANVTQAATGKAAANELQLSQKVKQNTGGEGDDNNDTSDNNGGGDRRLAAVDPTQSQDAWQSAFVNQTAAGNNKSDINQSQRQREFGGQTQSQNTTLRASSFDCAPIHGPSSPNACAHVRQMTMAVAGKNQNDLSQSINETARTDAAAAIQSQGSPDGGLDGQVHQESTTTTGKSVNNVHQRKLHNLSAPDDAKQFQFDPTSCCGFASQIGGTGNSETIGQSSVLNATSPTDQSADLSAESNTPTGTCTLTQHVSVNGKSKDNAFSTPPPCPPVMIVTSCTTSTDGTFCTTSTTFPGVGCEVECIPIPLLSFSRRD